MIIFIVFLKINKINFEFIFKHGAPGSSLYLRSGLRLKHGGWIAWVTRIWAGTTEHPNKSLGGTPAKTGEGGGTNWDKSNHFSPRRYFRVWRSSSLNTLGAFRPLPFRLAGFGLIIVNRYSAAAHRRQTKVTVRVERIWSWVALRAEAYDAVRGCLGWWVWACQGCSWWIWKGWQQWRDGIRTCGAGRTCCIIRRSFCIPTPLLLRSRPSRYISYRQFHFCFTFFGAHMLVFCVSSQMLVWVWKCIWVWNCEKDLSPVSLDLLLLFLGGLRHWIELPDNALR